jgi:hypothetical protein
MEDAALVRKVAAGYLRWFGSATQQHLREKADAALALRDSLSAQVWLDIAASAAEQARKWYVLYRKNSGSNLISAHDGQVAAVEEALRLLDDRLDVSEVSRFGGADSETIGREKLTKIRDAMRARGLDVVTPALLAAFLSAFVLMLIPGDQTGDLLSFLVGAAGFTQPM